MKTLLPILLFGLLVTDPSDNHPYPTKSNHVTSRIQEEAIAGGGLGIADNENSRKLSPYALSLIEDFEGWIPEPYDDASNYCTIGFGHLIAKAPCSSSRDSLKKYANPLARKDGESILSKDAALASAAVSKTVQVALTDQQFGALASFVFNVGADNFSRSSLVQYVNLGQFKSATREFGKWVKSNNKVLDGLVSRRACEAALFSGQIPVGGETTFNRTNCRSEGAAPDSEDLIDIATGER